MSRQVNKGARHFCLHLKIYAALHGQTIREYVLESIWEHLNRDNEEKQLLAITTQISPVLKEVWDNKKDDIY